MKRTSQRRWTEVIHFSRTGVPPVRPLKKATAGPAVQPYLGMPVRKLLVGRDRRARRELQDSGFRLFQQSAVRCAFLILSLLILPAGLRGAPGALDTGFGVGGLIAQPLNAGAIAVACQPDGRILVAGGFGVARLLQDGSLDASFGFGGQVTFSTSNQLFTVGALVLQPDGKIVVAVGSIVARLLASGELDPNFGTGGVARWPVLTNRFDTVTALALQPDGKIIASGFSNLQTGGGHGFLVVRFTVAGVSDPTFGSGGRALAPFGGTLVFGRAVALQDDGGIVIGGGVLAGRLAFGLARFTATGELDAGFGTGGELVLPIVGTTFSQVTSLALQSAGRIIAAGSAISTNPAFAMVRLNPDGSLDETFGVQGIQRTNFFPGSSDLGTAVAVLPDDKIIVAGSTGRPAFGRQIALACYTVDGSLDSSFGQGGLVTTQFPLSIADFANALALVGDGRIILAGSTPFNAGTNSCALVRYHLNDLAVTESATTNLVAVGDTLYYNILVENNRPAGVTGVRVTDSLPSSVQFESAFSGQGTCTNIGDQVICDLGSLASGGQAVVTIFASMRTTAHLSNRVLVSANETDPGLTNSATTVPTIDPLREQPHNLAVTALRAPKRVMLNARHPVITQWVAAEIQNRSPSVEQITNLTDVVTLEVQALTNSCPDLVPVLLTHAPQPRLPLLLQPKAKLSVYFSVTFSMNCVPDANATTPSAAHNDYVYRATVHQEVVNDNRDTYPPDDVCPRAALGKVTTVGGIIKDLGCGGKIYGGKFGAPVVTDVIVK